MSIFETLKTQWLKLFAFPFRYHGLFDKATRTSGTASSANAKDPIQFERNKKDHIDLGETAVIRTQRWKEGQRFVP